MYNFIIGLPFTAANQARLQRLSCALYCIKTGVSDADKKALVNGTLTIAGLKAKYPNDSYTALGKVISDIDAQAKGLQQVWSLSADGSTQDWYVGGFSLSDADWFFLRDWGLPPLPVTLRWGRFRPDGTLIESNTSLVNGQVYDEDTALRTLGLRPYKPPGQL